MLATKVRAIATNFVLTVPRCSPHQSGAFLGSRCAGEFLRWFVTLGIIYTVINPPFAVNDERSHLPRLHELSAGVLVSAYEEGEQVQRAPKSYLTMIRHYARVQKHTDGRIKWRKLAHDLTDWTDLDEDVSIRGGAGEYTPVAYAPQFPAIYLSRWLGLPTLWRLYLARLSSVLGCAFLMASAVAVAGPLRWAFFALGLMPMVVTQAAGVSGDGMTNALSLLFFALLAKGTFVNELARKERLLLLLVGGLLVYCKPPYLLFAFTLLCLKSSSPRPWLTRIGTTVLALVVDVGLLAVWRAIQDAAHVGPGTGYEVQMQWLRENPFTALRLGLYSLFSNIDDLTIQLVSIRDLIAREMEFTGGLVGALYLQLLVLLALGVHARADRAARWRVRWTTLLIAAACTGAFYLAMLLAFNGPGTPIIRGVQGRYFVPVMPALLLALSTFGRPTLSRWLTLSGSRRLLAPILALNAVCVLALFARYYLSVHAEWPY